jgi:hypothetical protein
MLNHVHLILDTAEGSHYVITDIKLHEVFLTVSMSSSAGKNVGGSLFPPSSSAP